jgi:hypothetical protein
MFKRLMAETPKFWKNVQIFGVVLSALCGTLMASPLELSNETIEFLKYLIAVGGTLAGVGQFAINDNGQAEFKED